MKDDDNIIMQVKKLAMHLSHSGELSMHANDDITHVPILPFPQRLAHIIPKNVIFLSYLYVNCYLPGKKWYNYSIEENFPSRL